MDSELQKALDKWDTHPNSILVDDRNLFIDAARKVANPDYEAARTRALEYVPESWEPRFTTAMVWSVVDAALGMEV